MTEELNTLLSDDEIEILKEIMNIAFGKATADLAELVDIFINLTVPDVQIMNEEGLKRYIKEEIKNLEGINLVEQKFWGEFTGSALLIFPADAGRELITLLTKKEIDSLESDPISELEKGSLMELGNILIGACVGRIADLLGDILTYSPPIVLVGDRFSKDGSFLQSQDQGPSAIMLRTVFNFEARNITGFLFLLTSQKSITWLKKALNDFMEQFE